MPQLVVAAAILDSLNQPTRLLCAARSYPAQLAGKFELPGGKVEAGEAPLDALQRELREELDCTVVVGKEIVPDGGGAWPINSQLEMRVWLAQVTAGQIPSRSAGHRELRWVALSDLLELDWLEPDYPIVRAIQEHVPA